MKRKKLWKSLTAWALILGMVFSDGAFVVNAQEAESQEKSLDKEEVLEKEEGLNEEESAGKEQPAGEKQAAQEEQPAEGELSAEEKLPVQDEQPAGESAEGKKKIRSAEKISEEKETEETGAIQKEKSISAASLDGPNEEDCVIDCSFNSMTGEEIRWGADYLEVYAGQSVNAEATVSSSVENPAPEVTWAVYADEAAMNAANTIDGILTQDGKKLTFAMKASGNEEDYILCATAGNTKKTFDLRIHKPRYEYGIDEDYVLLNGEKQLNAGCRYWNVHSFDGDFESVSVENVSVSPEGAEFLDCDNSEGYWRLRGKKAGTAKIKVTCQRIDGDPSLESTVTITKEIKVTDYECWLDYRYPDTGQEMVTNSTMMISDFVMTCDAVQVNEDGDTDYERKEIKNPEMSVVEYDEFILKGASFEGGNLVIKSGSKIGQTDVLVRAKSGTYVCEEQISIFVNEDYYMIFPQSIDNLNIGGLLDLNKLDLRLMHYDENNKTGKRVEDARFQFLYDEEFWEDQKKTDKYPVLKRITPQWAQVTIDAYIPSGTEEAGEPGEDCACSTPLTFNELGYDWGDIEYKYTYEGHPAGEGSPALFLGTPLTLEIAPKNTAMAFPEGCQFEWNITEGSSYVDKADNGASVTLTGKLPDAEEYGNVSIEAVVSYKEWELFRGSVWLSVQRPYYEYNVVLSENEVLKGESLHVKPVSVCHYGDVSAPDGANKEVPVTKVEIAGEYQWDDEGRETEAEKGKVASITGDAGTGWTIHGKDFGIVNLAITCEPVAGDSSNNTVQLSVCVVSDTYRLNWKYPDGYRGSINPGETFTINDITMTHGYLDDADKPVTENITDFTLAVSYKDEDDGTIYPWYDDEVIDVKVEDRSLVITGKKEGNTVISLRGAAEDGECDTAIPVKVLSKCSAHTWSSWSETKKATCEQPGLKKRTCQNCGTEETQTISATGHRWSAWTVKTSPTVFSAGTQTRTCSVCKKQESSTYDRKLAPTMKLTAKSLTMQVKQTTKAFKVTGMASGDYVSSVKSSNKKILKVSGVKKTGTFTLTAQKKTGTATLTIKLASGLEKKVKVKIQKNAVKTSKISGLSKKLKMKKKATKKLNPIITPVTSKDKIKYTSSNKKVATVSSKGVIKAKKAGKAKITVKAGSKKFTVTVTVK